MTYWKSDKVFSTNQKLRLSDFEKLEIQRNLPQAEDGNYYADAVFEGGGVKGMAFLGALRCFNDAGVRFRKVAGTSAGAITASLVAAGFSMQELEEIIGDLDFKTFLSQKKHFLILNGSPDNDLQGLHGLWMIANLALTGQKGQYSAVPFKEWLEGNLKQRQIETFQSFVLKEEEKLPWYKKRELKVVVSDISKQKMTLLPQDLPQYSQSPESFSVAEAVRLSMSIPFFFEPGVLGGSTIVDGGILSNFPLWVFDAESNTMPKCPTFGFQLTDEKPKPIKGVTDILMGMLSTMQVARDRQHMETHNQGRVFEIGTAGVSTTQFNLTKDNKDALYQEGYQAAKNFLLNRWSWKEHLKARGFSENEIKKEIEKSKKGIEKSERELPFAA
ncbi:MAG: patatin-like phospholipase family protein [Kovacikia sp.]